MHVLLGLGIVLAFAFGIGGLLVIAAVIVGAQEDRRPTLPGNLHEPVYRDDAGHHDWLRSLHEDEWEEAHVNAALTLVGQPSLEDIDCAMWELEFSGLPVYDVPDEGWGDR
jgi:hypothetical protein